MGMMIIHAFVLFMDVLSFTVIYFSTLGRVMALTGAGMSS